MALGIFLIVNACVSAFLSGLLVDKDSGCIPLGITAFGCAIFGALILEGII